MCHEDDKHIDRDICRNFGLPEKDGEESEDAILARLLGAGGASAPAKPAGAELTPQQKAAMQKQKVIKPTPPATPKAKAGGSRKTLRTQALDHGLGSAVLSGCGVLIGGATT